MTYYLNILLKLPKFIIFNNLILVILRFLKFPLDIFGISFFALIIINFIKQDVTDINLTFQTFDLSFINSFSINTMILFTMLIYFSKFFISNCLIYNEILISNKIAIFIQKVSLMSFFNQGYLKQTNQKVSNIYRSVTSEVKFCSKFISNLVEAISNIIIMIFAFILLFFLIKSKVNILVFSLIIIPFFIILFMKNKFSKHGKRRIVYNLRFYEYFHQIFKCIIDVNFFRIEKHSIKKLSEIKQDEWKSVYINKFLVKVTPVFVELSVITFILIVFYFNNKINILKNAEFFLFILISLRLAPYIYQLQLNINDIIQYHPSYLVLEKKLNYNKNLGQQDEAQIIDDLIIEYNQSSNLKTIKLKKGSRTLFYSKDRKKLSEFISSFMNPGSLNEYNIFVNKNIKSKNIVNLINGISYCDKNCMLFEGSLSDNITFFSKKIDITKLKDVIDFLDLQSIQHLSSLEATKLSEEIIAKISIARALYFDKQIFIFNDFFNKNLFNDKFLEKLFEKIDNKIIIVLSENKILENLLDIESL